MSQKLYPQMIVKILYESRKSGSIALTGSREERKKQLKELREKDISSRNDGFNFDIEKMQQRVNDKFFEVPDGIDSIEDFTEFLRQSVK